MRSRSSQLTFKDKDVFCHTLSVAKKSTINSYQYETKQASWIIGKCHQCTFEINQVYQVLHSKFFANNLSILIDFWNLNMSCKPIVDEMWCVPTDSSLTIN